MGLVLMHLGLERASLVLFIINPPFRSILQGILPSNPSEIISPQNMSVKPKSPTGKIMLLAASVIRRKRPDLRMGIGVRVPSKTLRNALGTEEDCSRYGLFRRKTCQDLPGVCPWFVHRLLFLSADSFFFPSPQGLLPQVSGCRVSFCNPLAHAPKQVGSSLLSLKQSALAAILRLYRPYKR